MKRVTLILALFITFSLTAQNKFTVEASGMDFTPQDLTVEIGDTIEWTNVLGIHNVNATQSTYPNNPESFTSGSPANAPWTYMHVMTIAGSYDYQCDVHVSSGMVGTITVNIATGITEVSDLNKLSVYPNPASNFIKISTLTKLKSLEIYSLTGEKIFEKLLDEDRVDISNLSPGVYFVKLSDENDVVTKRLVVN